MPDATTPSLRLRPEILALPRYRQGQSIEGGFKLSSNENPFPPLPGVLARVAAANDELNRYPDAAAPEIAAAIARKFGVDEDRVVVGSGSVALLAQLVIAAASAGDEVIYSWRSFEAYPWLPTLTGAVSVRVENTPDHRHDLDAMAAAVTDRTRVVILCTPNNPTGTIITTAEFEKFMASVPSDVIVVLDEAYYEFVTDPDAVRGEEHLDRYPNLVVFRTFSKAYGLAGLRIGYGIGPVVAIDAMRTTSIPLSVTHPAQQAALASLDFEHELQERVDALVVRRDALWTDLTEHGWQIPRPQGNFVWLPTGEHTEQAANIFARHGIMTRAFAPEGIRVSIGEEESVEKLLAASREIVENLPKPAAE